MCNKTYSELINKSQNYVLLFMGTINTSGQYARKKFDEKYSQSHVSTRIFHSTTWLNDWKSKNLCDSPLNTEDITINIAVAQKKSSRWSLSGMDHQIRRGRRLWKISKKMWNVTVILKCTISIISESSTSIEKLRPDWLKYNIVCEDTYNFDFWSTIRSSPENRKKQRRVWNIFNKM